MSTKSLLVKFEFKTEGEESEAVQCMKDQILSDLNEYSQFQHDEASLRDITFIDLDAFLTSLEATMNHTEKNLRNNYQRGYYKAYSDIIPRLKVAFEMK